MVERVHLTFDIGVLGTNIYTSVGIRVQLQSRRISHGCEAPVLSKLSVVSESESAAKPLRMWQAVSF